LAGGEDQAEGGGDADGRRAPNDERPDGLGDVFPACVGALDLFAGKTRLVQQD
jgi:hypothetical protein